MRKLILLLLTALMLSACAPAAAGPTPTQDWVETSLPSCGLTFSRPLGMDAPADCQPDGSVRMGGTIEIWVGTQNAYWLTCQTQALGDCPVMESVEQVTIGDKSATRIEGYIGSVGGRVPQRYRTFVFQRETDYVIFTLWALPESATTDDPSVIQPLLESDIDRFDRIVTSLRLY